MFRIERQSKDPSDAGRLRERQARTVLLLTRFRAVFPPDSRRQAVQCASQAWTAPARFAEAGPLDASNNYAERCMRTVFVGERRFCRSDRRDAPRRSVVLGQRLMFNAIYPLEPLRTGDAVIAPE